MGRTSQKIVCRAKKSNPCTIWYFTDKCILKKKFHFHMSRNVIAKFLWNDFDESLILWATARVHKVRGGLRRVESKLMMTIIKRQFFIRPGIANVNTERILCSLFHVYCWLFWKYTKKWTWLEIIWPLASNFFRASHFFKNDVKKYGLI